MLGLAEAEEEPVSTDDLVPAEVLANPVERGFHGVVAARVSAPAVHSEEVALRIEDVVEAVREVEGGGEQGTAISVEQLLGLRLAFLLPFGEAEPGIQLFQVGFPPARQHGGDHGDGQAGDRRDQSDYNRRIHPRREFDRFAPASEGTLDSRA
jgi:hypothetical protein